MRRGLEVGAQAECTVEVTDDMCPAFDGVVVHRVYSTWALGHQMETAARRVLVPYLEAHEEGMGTHLSVDHLSPAPVGCSVRVVAEATEVTEDRLVCEVRAYAGDRLVAQGRQVQRVLPKSVIREIIEKHR